MGVLWTGVARASGEVGNPEEAAEIRGGLIVPYPNLLLAAMCLCLTTDRT